MNTCEQIAKHFRDVHYGGNWTWSNLRDNLKDVSWQEATTKVGNLNTIAVLVYHIHYFVHAVIPVLQDGKLNAKDELSFDHPPIRSQQDWDNFLNVVWKDADTLAELVAKLPESKLNETFCEEKYGTYYRNLNGIIEHTHYHLGQIALIKKLIQNQK